MAKRPMGQEDPIDIFSSPRFSEAMVRSAISAPPETSHPPAAAEEPTAPSTSDVVATSLAADPGPSEEMAESESDVSQPELPVRDTRGRAARSNRGPKPQTSRSTPPVPAGPVDPHIPFRFRVPHALRAEFQAFKSDLSAKLGVMLDDSNIGRPYLEILLTEFRDRILEVAAAHQPRLRRPAHTDFIAMAEFDEAIGGILREAIRRRPGRNPSNSER